VTGTFVVRVSIGLSAVALAVACSGGDNRSGAGGTTAAGGSVSGSVDLNGAGATFPQPIYNKWFSDYAAKTGVKINYQSIGSGGGVRQITEQTVDFGASDAAMSDDELAKAKGGALMHFPTVLGAVVLTYNVPEITQPLKASGPVIADIFMGKITKWNDARIAALNPGVTLPNSDILVVHRSDGSGTTFVWTDYLSAISPEWRTKVGKAKEVKWPVGIGGKGNEGVAGQVKQTPGSIGYVELAYAKQNQLPYAQVKNAAGNFVEPNINSITAAAAAANIPANTDYRVSIVNSPGPQAYPISSFTWLLIYRNQPDAAKAKKLKDFLRWAYSEGEAAAAALDYARLPEAMTTRLVARLDSIGGGSTP
jgi:phosphate transport system substrate-binding protein